MGTDLSVVNDARVSFSKESALVDGELSKADTSLIQFLARGCTSGDWTDMVSDLICIGADEDYFMSTSPADYLEVSSIMKRIKNMPTHWAPFAHTAIKLKMKAPIFVARQLAKHQVGLVWSEISRRYVSDEPEFYRPEVWRKSAASVKQGSSECGIDNQEGTANLIDLHNRFSVRHYNSLLTNGVCPEQARMVLPQSMYIEWHWTGNLYAFANVFIQRTDSHAQKETQEIAHQIGSIISPLFPVSWKALTQ
jgi:thymidylate synthase (FAD)